MLHQIHHSTARIETLTSFYTHRLEIALNSMVSSAILFRVLGAGLEGHRRTPRWTGYFLQRPEHHSMHHEQSVRHYNYGDITWWDRLFGTFCDAEAFSPACGFDGDREQRLMRMLAFEDVNK